MSIFGKKKKKNYTASQIRNHVSDGDGEWEGAYAAIKWDTHEV